MVPATPVVKYNKCMGGVDMNNKMAKIVKSRKSYKWYTRIDRKCVHCLVQNISIEQKDQSLCKKDQKFMEFREFALQILNDLVGIYRYA